MRHLGPPPYPSSLPSLLAFAEHREISPGACKWSQTFGLGRPTAVSGWIESWNVVTKEAASRALKVPGQLQMAAHSQGLEGQKMVWSVFQRSSTSGEAVGGQAGRHSCRPVGSGMFQAHVAG